MLVYEPETGILRWRVTSGRAIEGQEAGGVDRWTGYHKVRLVGFPLLSHHVAWALMTGAWPERLDHADGCPSNNVWSNLRLCTQSQNMGNQRINSRNSTGFKGVSFHKATGKFQAQIKVGKQQLALGVYETKEEAAAVYQKAAKEHFGEFASDGIRAALKAKKTKRGRLKDRLPTAEEAREFLSYDPETGILRQKKRRSWRHRVGDIAGMIENDGYRRIGFFGRKYSAHRLAFLIMTGRWPTLFIDHKNRDRSDNRWANLIEVTQSQNILAAYQRARHTTPIA